MKPFKNCHGQGRQTDLNDYNSNVVAAQIEQDIEVVRKVAESVPSTKSELVADANRSLTGARYHCF